VTDLEVTIAAAQAGAGVLRGRYGGALTRYAKSDRDFATEADLEAEAAIQAVISAACPGDAFEGEERGLTGDAAARRTWLVDPLCGTLNFAAQTPLLCVNVALREDGAITAAAVADPIAATLWWTDGDAVWARTDGDGDARVVPSPVSRLVDVDFDGRPEWAAGLVSAPAFANRFGIRVSSTSLALVWVATGQRAGYVFGGDVRGSVHFVAGVALCRAAGCVVTTLSGRAPDAAGDGLVAAADAADHAALLDAISGSPAPGSAHPV